jgi:hypothetical protein
VLAGAHVMSATRDQFAFDIRNKPHDPPAEN